MMTNLTIWDNRLLRNQGDGGGWGPPTYVRPPRGPEVLEVDEHTPLQYVIQWVKSKSSQFGRDVRARIMAHGVWPDPAPGSRTHTPGGMGAWFCKEKLTLDTIPFFSPWLGLGDGGPYVKEIYLLICGIAYINKGLEGKIGDGNLLCFRFAQITGATVFASTSIQDYDPRTLNFGEWEGNVLTYGPTGALLNTRPTHRKPQSEQCN